jgi:hypothetical protein
MPRLFNWILKPIRRLLRKASRPATDKEQVLLRATVLSAADTITAISSSFSAPWTKNPGPNEKAPYAPFWPPNNSMEPTRLRAEIRHLPRPPRCRTVRQPAPAPAGGSSRGR